MRAFLAVLAVTFAAAAGGPGPHPLSLKVGEVAAICKTGTIMCPASDAICDDPSIAEPADSPDGLAFKALKPGTTLCSAASAAGSGLRRVYRITVKE
jgi:hypothetical protein